MAMHAAVHAAAVDAVVAWTTRALRSYQAPSRPPPVEEPVQTTALAHSTASMLAAQWIQDGLDHVQKQQQQQPEHHDQGLSTEPSAEATSTSMDDNARNSRPDDPELLTRDSALALGEIRSAAERTASATIQHVLFRFRCGDATPSYETDGRSTVEATTDVLQSGDDVNAALHDGNSVSSTGVAHVTESHARDAEAEAAANAGTSSSRASRVFVASHFVSSLVEEAVHHHAAALVVATHEPLPTPPPVILVSRPVHTPTPPVLEPPTDDAATTVSVLPLPVSNSSSNIERPPVVLAAVKPPKQGARRPQRKPIPSSAPSPRLAPVELRPKTIDPRPSRQPQPQPLPSAGRTPRVSPRPVSHDQDHDHELSQSPSPPRLRKLEEYLEMHPVDRAKKVYRPRRPLAPAHHAPSPMTSPHLNGYDSEHDNSDEEHDDPQTSTPPPPRVKLAPLRGAATAKHPSLPAAPVAASSLVVVDRPDRLGLLNKPKKRTGFCQQCGFEGRSCKVSDCLKHQLLR